MAIEGISKNTYNLIKDGIKASNLRAKTISNNIANINTKKNKRCTSIWWK